MTTVSCTPLPCCAGAGISATTSAMHVPQNHAAGIGELEYHGGVVYAIRSPHLSSRTRSRRECCHHHGGGPQCSTKASARHALAARGDWGRASSLGGELGYPGRPDGRVSNRHGMHHAARREAGEAALPRMAPLRLEPCQRAPIRQLSTVHHEFPFRATKLRGGVALRFYL